MRRLLTREKKSISSRRPTAPSFFGQGCYLRRDADAPSPSERADDLSKSQKSTYRPPAAPLPVRSLTGDRLPEGGGGGAIVRFAFPGPPAAPPTGPVPDGGTGCRRGAARGRAFDWGFHLASRRTASRR